jgi:hypothetical protein
MNHPNIDASGKRGSRIRAWSTAALILAAGSVLSAAVAAYGFASARSGERVVTVRGLAEREVDADLAVWPLTFSVASDSLESLRSQVAAGTEAIRVFLKDADIADGDISFAPPTIKDTRADLYGGPSEGKTYRYVAQATVLVRSKAVGAVLGAMQRSLDLVGKGVAVTRNYESQSQFLFTGLNAVKPQMIAEATRNARAAAEQFAQDSGSRVGKIKRASQGLFSIDDADPSLPQRKILRVITTVDYFLVD